MGTKQRGGSLARSPGLRAGARRGGVAILMVLMCVVVGVVLASAVLTARDNSGPIGSNAVSASASEWSAESAANFAVATLQTSTDWLSEDSTLLMDSFEIAGGVVTVTVADEDGNPPTQEDTTLVLTATAEVNGVTSTVQKIVTRTPTQDATDAFDPYLDEYGVFVGNSLTTSNAASIGVWNLSPSAATMDEVNVGGTFSGSSSLTLGSLLGTTQRRVNMNESSDSLIEILLSGLGVTNLYVRTLPLDVPALGDAVPAALSGLPSRAATKQTFTGAAASTTLTPGAYADVQVSSGAVLTLSGDYSISTLTVDTGGVIVLSGDCRLSLTQLRVITKGAVEFADSTSRARILVRDAVLVNDGVVGLPRALAANGARTHASVTEYVDPARLRIIAVAPEAGGNSAPTFSVQASALMVASVHMPAAVAQIRSSAALFGRITAYTLNLGSGTAVYYCPSMNNKQGFCELVSPLYDNNGEPIDGLLNAINDFDESQGLDAFKAHMDVQLAALAGEADDGDCDDDGVPDYDQDADYVSLRVLSRAKPTAYSRDALSLEQKALYVEIGDTSVKPVSP